MLKRLSFLAAFLAPCLALLAQTNPQYSFSQGTDATATLFGNASGKHNQTLYLPGEIGLDSTAAPVTVNRIYFRHGQAQSQVILDSLVLKVGQPAERRFRTNSSFQNVFFRGLTTVYTRPLRDTLEAGTGGEWFSFPLDQTFQYDPSRPLVIDVSWKQTSNFQFINLAAFRLNRRAFSANLTDTAGSSSSSFLVHFGIATGPASLIGRFGKPLFAYPQPAAETVSLTLNSTAGGIIKVTGTDGKIAITEQVAKGTKVAKLNVALLAKGTYVFHFRTADGKIETGKLIKE